MLAACANAVSGEEQTQYQDQTLSGKKLTVSGEGLRNIELTAWSDPGIRIETTKHAPGRVGASAQQQFDSLKVDIQQDGDTVRVTVPSAPGGIVVGQTAYTTLRVSVPAGVELDIDSNNANITLNNVDGSGAIATNSGTVQADGSRGTLKFNATDGSITVRGYSGSIETTTESGSINIRDARDTILTMRSASGAVEFHGNLDAAQNHQIESESGKVSIHLPSSSKLRLDLESESGTIDTNFDVSDARREQGTLEGTVNGGTATLAITTSSGDIEVVTE